MTSDNHFRIRRDVQILQASLRPSKTHKWGFLTLARLSLEAAVIRNGWLMYWNKGLQEGEILTSKFAEGSCPGYIDSRYSGERPLIFVRLCQSSSYVFICKYRISKFCEDEFRFAVELKVYSNNFCTKVMRDVDRIRESTFQQKSISTATNEQSDPSEQRFTVCCRASQYCRHIFLRNEQAFFELCT